jgi:hypothetical protein
MLEAVDKIIVPPRYPGWAASVNLLAKLVLEDDPECQVIVTGGDDTFPAPDSAAILEQQFVHHFAGTLGVMQPDGDLDFSPNAARIAWSPWLGRAWCLRANEGRGPLWPEYRHGWADLELREVATQLRRFWARPDLRQEHRYWKQQQPKVRPAHLWHVPLHDKAAEELYHRRAHAGFPGSELLP